MMARRRRRQTKALRPNIRVTETGIQLYTKVGGHYRSRRYRFTKTLTTAEQLLEVYDDEIRAWLAINRDAPSADDVDDAEPGTLEFDLPRYRKARAAMPSIEGRMKDLQAWVDVFGLHKRTRSITELEMKMARDQWLTVGPRMVQMKGKDKGHRWKSVAKPLSATKVNHRLRALSNLFRTLYPDFPNPARRVDEANEPEPIPRSVTYDALHQILEKMPDRSRREKGKKYKGEDSESLAKLRVEAMVWTGITPSELQRIEEPDVDEDLEQVVIPPRLKGEGAPGRVIPLKRVPEGMRALRRLKELKALGLFNDGVVRRAFQRGARAAGYQGLTLYTVRHSFVTQVLRVTKDFQKTQLLAGHVDPRTTLRYSMAAILTTLEDGMGQMRDHAMAGRSRLAKAGRSKKRAR